MSMTDYQENPILQEDLQKLASAEILNRLEKNSVIMVTGATGMIGSQIVKALAMHSRAYDKNLKIIALIRSEEKARRIFGQLLEDGYIALCKGDITDFPEIEGKIDYIIHGASPTSSRYFVEQPVETIVTALQGTQNILEIARVKNVKKLVYLSSLEVYGTPAADQQYITEQDYGYIDPMQVRSSYSEGKRMAECLCVAYAKEYSIPVVVARLSQTFGAGVAYDDSRVFAEFARCAIEGKNIVLHTEGKTVRSYCHTSDAITAIFYMLFMGTSGEAYNVTNMQTVCSIKEMAELVCKLVPEKGIEVKIEIPEDIVQFGYNPEMVIRLDSSKLESLGWTPTLELKNMFDCLIKSMNWEKNITRSN